MTDGSQTTPAVAATRPRWRTPYFDRPKHPHDWRWYVGGLGRILITLGLLMFAFVAYQLWGTGIATARAQDALDRQFNEMLTAAPSISPTTTTAAPASTLPGDTTTTLAPDQTTTTSAPAPQPWPALNHGDLVARLQIPTIGLSKYLVEGVTLDDLKKGPGHFRETPLPGQLGNAAIAGHRTTWGHPFLDLDKVKLGDTIEVDTVVGGHFVYRVVNVEVVSPSDYAKVIPTVDPTKATLTLATCHPAYTARQRLIVQADLVVDESSTAVAPPLEPLPPDTEVLPADDVATTDSVAGDSTAAPVDTTPTSSADESTIDDSFNQGWFADKSAIPQVIWWGLGLLVVVAGSYYAGKSVRRLYVSFIIGVVPFVVVLYFWFENVNRLLPPGL